MINEMIGLDSLKQDIAAQIRALECKMDSDVPAAKDFMLESLKFCQEEINFVLEEIIDDLMYEKEAFFQFAYTLRVKDKDLKD